MCGFAAAEGPLPPLSVYPGALGQTTGVLIFGDTFFTDPPSTLSK